MYVLTSVARDDMEIEVTFHATQDDAYQNMLESIKGILLGVEDIMETLNEDDGEFIDSDGACIQSNNFGTVCYRIDEVPNKI